MWRQKLRGTKIWRNRRRNRFHKRPPTVNLGTVKIAQQTPVASGAESGQAVANKFTGGVLFGLCLPDVSPTSALSSSDLFTRLFAQNALLLVPRGWTAVLIRSNRDAVPRSG